MYSICNMFINYVNEEYSYTILTKKTVTETLEEAMYMLEAFRALDNDDYKKSIWIVPEEDDNGEIDWKQYPSVTIEYTRKIDNGNYGVGWMITSDADDREIGETWNYIMPEDLVEIWKSINDIPTNDIERERFVAYTNGDIQAPDIEEEFKVYGSGPEEDEDIKGAVK